MKNKIILAIIFFALITQFSTAAVSRYSPQEMLSMLDKVIVARWIYNNSTSNDTAYYKELKPTMIREGVGIGYTGDCTAGASNCSYLDNITWRASFVQGLHDSIPGVKIECMIFEDVKENHINGTKCRTDVCGSERYFDYDKIKNPNSPAYANIVAQETQLYYKSLGRQFIDIGCDGISFSWIAPLYRDYAVSDSRVINAFAVVTDDWRQYAENIGVGKIFVAGSLSSFSGESGCYPVSGLTEKFDYLGSSIKPDTDWDKNPDSKMLISNKRLNARNKCLFPQENHISIPFSMDYDTTGDTQVGEITMSDDIAVLASKNHRTQLLSLIDNYVYIKAANPLGRQGTIMLQGSRTYISGLTFCGGDSTKWTPWRPFLCFDRQDRQDFKEFFLTGKLPNDSTTGFLANSYNALWDENLMDWTAAHRQKLVEGYDLIERNHISRKEMMRGFLKNNSGNFFTQSPFTLSNESYIQRTFKAAKFSDAQSLQLNQGLSYLSSHSREQYFNALWDNTLPPVAPPTNPLITSIQPTNLQLIEVGLAKGSSYYFDRDYTITSDLPSILSQTKAIRTPVDPATTTDLSFTTNVPIRVVLAWDTREVYTAWQSGWTTTNTRISVSDSYASDNGTMLLIYKDFQAGNITIPKKTDKSNYIIFVKEISLPENCSNGIDDDKDGVTDCQDLADCPTAAACGSGMKCNLQKQCIITPTSTCPDSKKDGTINIFDLVKIVKAINENDKAYDLTNDGTINIQDLQATASKFGQNC